MSSQRKAPAGLEVHPLTPERWTDLERLFGTRGACGGCWCMWWRLTQSEFDRKKGPGTKRAMKRIVKSGEVAGLIAYIDGAPIAWCSLAPREQFSRLARSRVLKPVDDKPVWSIVCFFVAKPFRRQGITVKLLKAAVDFARTQGAKIIEGYPIDPKSNYADAFAHTGLASAFEKAGFKEALRRSPTRPIMRRQVKPAARKASRGLQSARSPKCGNQRA